ncbi:efflux RND transporter permease subunit [Poseidonocella sedimentorum]|uniref:Multidrug efflux pump n=1 Tax=Poseidonocella sedimentorum TaxID=871652 RepID=A0A1I6EK78_9RHOB|nr:efflux RND transporter permease subunit [Poseidonocella sedimentorum]SFR18186.1 multidrug efflux pump [Poseidonocella sedimentorum]
MTGIVDWAASRARMILAFIVLSLVSGGFAYTTLPKEGEPDIDIPALFVSVPFPGISARDAETLLVKPMETELAGLDGLKSIGGTAAEGYAGVSLEFEFGWDKTKVMADVRDAMNTAEANFPDGAEKYTINEINFSEFPIIIVNLTGRVPERTMARIAKDLQDRLESLDAVLEAGIAGNRDEMMEVLIDPVRLESYNVTAGELITVVQNNNQLIAAGEVETDQGSFSIKIPSSFDEARDIYDLPVKTNGARVVTLGDLATISLTFEDRTGTARFNGAPTVALQVVKRKGFNLIDTAELIKAEVAAAQEGWPPELAAAVEVGTSNDQSRVVGSMVSQLEDSVITAIALVMLVSLATLGLRPALLVGFAIPTSFLLCFVLLGVMGIAVSNIVMFGLILAVGMLVDGAIVVVEYADKRIREGTGPMHAYVEAAKRMFWPIVSSTATTLCAFLPMLFWPGIPGEFMGMLPVTLIFVLSASLVVALVYLPVMGGVVGRTERWLATRADRLARGRWLQHAGLALGSILAIGAADAILSHFPFRTFIPTLFGGLDSSDIMGSILPRFAAAYAVALGIVAVVVLLMVGILGLVIAILAVSTRVRLGASWLGQKLFGRRETRVDGKRHRTGFGYVIQAITANPVMPILSIGAVVVFVGSVFIYFGSNNNGVEFFVESEPEQAIVYVRARGNLSLTEKDAVVREAEEIVLAHPGILNAFSFAGEGGLGSNTGGAESPKDTIGEIQLETIPWEDRRDRPELDGDIVLEELSAALKTLPGVEIEILNLAMGPASGKPVHLRLKGDDWDDLLAATEIARARFEETEGLTLVEDTLPLPGIDWQIDVDVEKAGRYGADVATVGAMVQLVTRGILLDTMPIDSSDEEIEIRVRLPEADRLLSTLDTLKVRTPDGLIPLANFTTRTPVAKLAEINRQDQKRFFDVKADVLPGLTTDTGAPMTPNTLIAALTEWLKTDPLPAGITWEWTGDQEDQAESQAFLQTAFAAALGLMFIILLAQFNSLYNSVLVLLAVVLSTTGCLIGMLVMGQPFSIIMTGTGIVALAGIVVNNNIVLIDTYQDYARTLPRIEAIIRTAEDRIRPVLLTTLTTMAGLAPMMYGLSVDIFSGGYSIDSPTALWWKQLATAVVFGLGIATVLTLIFTPSMLAARVWATEYALWLAALAARLGLGRTSRAAQDWALKRDARHTPAPEIIWTEESPEPGRLRAAE